MTTETKVEHVYYLSGHWIRGYGSSMDPHRCGDKDEPCITRTYTRQVSEWEIDDIEENGG